MKIFFKTLQFRNIVDYIFAHNSIHAFSEARANSEKKSEQRLSRSTYDNIILGKIKINFESHLTLNFPCNNEQNKNKETMLLIFSETFISAIHDTPRYSEGYWNSS